MAERRITQIMPADGWAAVFTEGNEEVIVPLAGWALVDEPGTAGAVVGLVAWDKVELCDSQANFVRYIHVPDMFFDEEYDEEFDEEFDEDEDYEDDDGEEPPFDRKSGLLN